MLLISGGNASGCQYAAASICHNYGGRRWGRKNGRAFAPFTVARNRGHHCAQVAVIIEGGRAGGVE